jgi:hypothetical protein
MHHGGTENTEKTQRFKKQTSLLWVLRVSVVKESVGGHPGGALP